MVLINSPGLDVTMATDGSTDPSYLHDPHNQSGPWTPQWPQVVAQIPGISMPFGIRINRQQHSPQAEIGPWT